MWFFDEGRRRFRRLPHDADPDAPALESDWQPYHALEVDEATGAFTVQLDADGSRFLRAFLRDRAGPGGIGDAAEHTSELPVRKPGGSGPGSRPAAP